MSFTGQASRTGPLVGSGVLGRVAPFALTALAAVAVLGLTELRRPWVFLLGCLLAAAIIGMSTLVPWSRLPTVAQNIPPLAFFVGVVLLRDAGGGADSGVGPLVLLPVCWLALYGGRAALTASLFATGSVFFGPWLLIGGPAYPDVELRRGLVLMLVAGLVGYSVQGLVRALHEHGVAATSATAQAAQAAEQLAAVAQVRHSMQVNQDPREVICEGARVLSAAKVASCWNPRATPVCGVRPGWASSRPLSSYRWTRPARPPPTVCCWAPAVRRRRAHRPADPAEPAHPGWCGQPAVRAGGAPRAGRGCAGRRLAQRDRLG